MFTSISVGVGDPLIFSMILKIPNFSLYLFIYFVMTGEPVHTASK